MQKTRFVHDNTYPFTKDTFKGYIEKIQSGVPDNSELLSTEYSFFRFKIHEQCYQLANARRDGVEFMQWLKRNGWRIIICTYRDLRRANDCTRKWLKDNDIPFDHLFMAWNKIVFCNIWGIKYLIDDDVFNIIHGGRYGVNVYFPITEKNKRMQCDGARGFKTFDEVKQWILR